MARVLMLTRGGDDFGTGHCYRTRWLAKALIEQPWVDEVHVISVGPVGHFWAGADLHVTPAISPEAAFEAATGSNSQLTVVDWLDSDSSSVAALAATMQVALLDDYGPAAEEPHLVINALLSPLEVSERRTTHGRVVGGAEWVQLNPNVVKIRGVAGATSSAMATELRTPLQPGRAQSLLLAFAEDDRSRRNIQGFLTSLAGTRWDGRIIVMPAPPGLLVPDTQSVELRDRDESFVDVLAACDMVACYDGLTLWEAAFLGIPAVVLPKWSTGQRLEQAGCCITVDSDMGLPGQAVAIGSLIAALSEDTARRGRMSAAGMRLLDGRGLQRTVDAIGELVAS